VRRLVALRGRDCGLCGAPMAADDITLEHVRPKACGGSSALKNLSLSHSECNRRRGTRDFWAVRRRALLPLPDEPQLRGALTKRQARALRRRENTPSPTVNRPSPTGHRRATDGPPTENAPDPRFAAHPKTPVSGAKNQAKTHP